MINKRINDQIGKMEEKLDFMEIKLDDGRNENNLLKML